MSVLSPLLDRGRTPADWVNALAHKGIDISERTLREKANRLGACHKLGRAMIITPEQIDLILSGDGEPCHSKHTSEARPGGRRAGSNSTGSPSPTTTGAALEHLKKVARGSGAGTRKSGGNVVFFSGAKKPSRSQRP